MPECRGSAFPSADGVSALTALRRPGTCQGNDGHRLTRYALAARLRENGYSRRNSRLTRISRPFTVSQPSVRRHQLPPNGPVLQLALPDIEQRPVICEQSLDRREGCYNENVDCDLAPEDPGLGGYDASYRQCPCFWGTEPGAIVRVLGTLADLNGARVLDLGCGEGKNAAFLARLGCKVEAWDISERALENAKRAWPAAPVLWRRKDATTVSAEMRRFDIVVAYGLFHCLSYFDIAKTISNMQRITDVNGYNIAVCFNDRKHINIQAAHPSFVPTCLPHHYYQLAYRGWSILHDTDADLVEQHPTNNVRHTHSMTRILAQRVTNVERSS